MHAVRKQPCEQLDIKLYGSPGYFGGTNFGAMIPDANQIMAYIATIKRQQWCLMLKLYMQFFTKP